MTPIRRPGMESPWSKPPLPTLSGVQGLTGMALGEPGFAMPRFLMPGLRVGILGGSFNPAHDGHRHISIVALRRLRLHGVIWLLSPQNPLKPAHETAGLKERAARAWAVARHPNIFVSGIEGQLGTQYTANTLPALRRRFPGTRFVWIMGADNLIQLPRWQHWTRILQTMPMAVVDRPGFSLRAQMSEAAQHFRSRRVMEERAASVVTAKPPAWVYLHSRLHPLSASEIRRSLPDGTAWTDHPHLPSG